MAIFFSIIMVITCLTYLPVLLHLNSPGGHGRAQYVLFSSLLSAHWSMPLHTSLQRTHLELLSLHWKKLEAHVLLAEKRKKNYACNGHYTFKSNSREHISVC